MARMLLRIALPQDGAARKKVVKIKDDYVMIFEVEESFALHQPINGGTWMLDARAIADPAWDVVTIAEPAV